MNSIMSFKLINGEEVVAEVLSQPLFEEGNRNTEFTLRRPHVLQFQQVAPGQVGLVFIPWALSNPVIDKVVLPSTSVITSFSPALEVERQYLEQTSGISLAPANSSIFAKA